MQRRVFGKWKTTSVNSFCKRFAFSKWTPSDHVRTPHRRGTHTPPHVIAHTYHTHTLMCSLPPPLPRSPIQFLHSPGKGLGVLPAPVSVCRKLMSFLSLFGGNLLQKEALVAANVNTA